MLKTHKRHGKDSKYTSAIDISITGGGTGSAVGRGRGEEGSSVGGAGIFIACIGSISSVFSLHHLKDFLSTYSYSFPYLCELPKHFLGFL